MTDEPVERGRRPPRLPRRMPCLAEGGVGCPHIGAGGPVATSASSAPIAVSWSTSSRTTTTTTRALSACTAMTGPPSRRRRACETCSSCCRPRRRLSRGPSGSPYAPTTGRTCARCCSATRTGTGSPSGGRCPPMTRPRMSPSTRYRSPSSWTRRRTSNSPGPPGRWRGATGRTASRTSMSGRRRPAAAADHARLTGPCPALVTLHG